MKEFPTCRFLSTALSQSDEDSAPSDLREQFNEFLDVAQTFLVNENFFTVYDTLDTLLDDLNEALGRKKGLVKTVIRKAVKKIQKYQELNMKRLDKPDLFTFSLKNPTPDSPLRWALTKMDLAELLLALSHARVLRTPDLSNYDIFMTRKEAAAFLGKSVRQLDRLCEKNVIRRVEEDGVIRICKSELIRYQGIDIDCRMERLGQR